MTIKRILLPTDFSDTAEHTLGYAREMAERFGSEVHVLHVVADPTPQEWAVGAAALVVSDLLKTWEADAERRLAGISLDGIETVRAIRVGHAFVENPAVRHRQRDRHDRDGYARARAGRAPAARQRSGDGRAQGSLSGAHRAAPGPRVRHAGVVSRGMSRSALCGRPTACQEAEITWSSVLLRFKWVRPHRVGARRLRRQSGWLQSTDRALPLMNGPFL